MLNLTPSKVLGDASSTVSMTTFVPVSTSAAPPFTPTTSVIELVLDESNPSEGGFTFFTGNVSSGTTFLDIAAIVGGSTFTVENFNLQAASDSFVFVDEVSP